MTMLSQIRQKYRIRTWTIKTINRTALSTGQEIKRYTLKLTGSGETRTLRLYSGEVHRNVKETISSRGMCKTTPNTLKQVVSKQDDSLFSGSKSI